jgi:hypothetical protein
MGSKELKCPIIEVHIFEENEGKRIEKWGKVIQTRMLTRLDQKGDEIRTAQTREGFLTPVCNSERNAIIQQLHLSNPTGIKTEKEESFYLKKKNIMKNNILICFTRNIDIHIHPSLYHHSHFHLH